MLDVQIAQALLQIKAVGFTPYQPITFKSGILSPVYVDNRQVIFWPQQWRLVIEGFRQVIEREALAFDVIAGIATGGVPHSAALAYTLQKPTIYIRPQSKEHGKQNRVEGGDIQGKRVLLIEDLVTTGGSSLGGVAALRDAGATVEDCLAITTYGFAMSQQAFQIAGVRLHTLTNFNTIVQVALQEGLFGEAEQAIIESWLQDPHQWAERQEDVSPGEV